MVEGRLTYEQLFDTLRREKSRDELQELDSEFYAKVHDFIAEKKAAISVSGPGMHSLVGQRAQIEYQNVQKILKELYERREKKIVTLALHHTRTMSTVVDTEALQQVEHELFDSIVERLRNSRGQILTFLPTETYEPEVLSKEPQAEPSVEASVEQEEPEVVDGGTVANSESDDSGIPVKFLATVPKFVGNNMQVFGPFQQGDETRLPEDVAQILIRKGRAEALELKNEV